MFILMGILIMKWNELWNELLIKQHYLIKKEFYSNLNMEEVTAADAMHGKRVCKDF